MHYHPALDYIYVNHHYLILTDFSIYITYLSLGQYFKAAADDHASIGVPPQLLDIRPIGILSLSCRSRPKNQQTAEKSFTVSVFRRNTVYLRAVKKREVLKHNYCYEHNNFNKNYKTQSVNLFTGEILESLPYTVEKCNISLNYISTTCSRCCYQTLPPPSKGLYTCAFISYFVNSPGLAITQC